MVVIACSVELFVVKPNSLDASKLFLFNEINRPFFYQMRCDMPIPNNEKFNHILHRDISQFNSAIFDNDLAASTCNRLSNVIPQNPESLDLYFSTFISLVASSSLRSTSYKNWIGNKHK